MSSACSVCGICGTCGICVIRGVIFCHFVSFCFILCHFVSFVSFVSQCVVLYHSSHLPFV
jgi:hypothetical protein